MREDTFVDPAEKTIDADHEAREEEARLEADLALKQKASGIDEKGPKLKDGMRWILLQFLEPQRRELFLWIDERAVFAQEADRVIGEADDA